MQSINKSVSAFLYFLSNREEMAHKRVPSNLQFIWRKRHILRLPVKCRQSMSFPPRWFLQGRSASCFNSAISMHCAVDCGCGMFQTPGRFRYDLCSEHICRWQIPSSFHRNTFASSFCRHLAFTCFCKRCKQASESWADGWKSVSATSSWAVICRIVPSCSLLPSVGINFLRVALASS